MRYTLLLTACLALAGCQMPEPDGCLVRDHTGSVTSDDPGQIAPAPGAACLLPAYPDNGTITVEEPDGSTTTYKAH